MRLDTRRRSAAQRTRACFIHQHSDAQARRTGAAITLFRGCTEYSKLRRAQKRPAHASFAVVANGGGSAKFACFELAGVREAGCVVLRPLPQSAGDLTQFDRLL